MDVQLQELVDRIKKDGVETAEANAAEILKKAREEAAAIVSAAQVESESLSRKAREDADRLEKAAVAAIRQAGRNILISFREGVTAELSALVKSGTSKAFTPEMLKDLIPAAVKSWISNTGSDDIAVLLSPADAERLQSVFVSALKAEIDRGLEIRKDASVSAGFRIGTKDGASYYDFSAEAVAGLFSAYLNPRVAEILKSAAKEL